MVTTERFYHDHEQGGPISKSMETSDLPVKLMLVNDGACELEGGNVVSATFSQSARQIKFLQGHWNFKIKAQSRNAVKATDFRKSSIHRTMSSNSPWISLPTTVHLTFTACGYCCFLASFLLLLASVCERVSSKFD